MGVKRARKSCVRENHMLLINYRRNYTIPNDDMELLYLLCSILSTCVTSLLLSIRLLLLRFVKPRYAVEGYASVAAFYEGTVWHERRRPVHHSFRYSVRYALFDLDCFEDAPNNHLSADRARCIANSDGPVLLLTIPPSVGYEQNPLSVYYCYDLEGSTRILRRCIAEVTNTPWGERVTFVFSPNSDLVAKPLHVSPFMDMLGNWSLKTNDPDDNLHIVIKVHHPELGNYFTASLTAKRATSLEAGDYAWFFWLMPHKVALWIYWHALNLWWKSVPFVQHPRYNNPKYKEDTLHRNDSIQCCPSFGDNGAYNPRQITEEHDVAAKASNNRCITWRDAPWPWC